MAGRFGECPLADRGLSQRRDRAGHHGAASLGPCRGAGRRSATRRGAAVRQSLGPDGDLTSAAGVAGDLIAAEAGRDTTDADRDQSLDEILSEAQAIPGSCSDRRPSTSIKQDPRFARIVETCAGCAHPCRAGRATARIKAMNLGDRLSMGAIVVAGVATFLLLAVATMAIRQILGLSPGMLLQLSFAAAAQFDPRLAACPLIIVGND